MSVKGPQNVLNLELFNTVLLLDLYDFYGVFFTTSISECLIQRQKWPHWDSRQKLCISPGLYLISLPPLHFQTNSDENCYLLAVINQDQELREAVKKLHQNTVSLEGPSEQRAAFLQS